MVTRTHKFGNEIQILGEVDIVVQKRVKSVVDDISAKLFRIKNSSLLDINKILTCGIANRAIETFIRCDKEILH